MLYKDIEDVADANTAAVCSGDGWLHLRDRRAVAPSAPVWLLGRGRVSM